MGLENGIVIKNVTRKQIPFFWPFRFPHDKDLDGDAEICYWPKCWGLREIILLDILHTNDEGDEYPLTTGNVKRIETVIRKYIKQPDWWESRSFWTYDEAKYMLHTNVWNLWWLRLWMLLHKKETVVFYDSF